MMTKDISSKEYMTDLPARLKGKLRVERLERRSAYSDDLAVDHDDFDALEQRNEREGGLIFPQRR